MTKFHAVVVNEEGKEFVYDAESTVRIIAQQEVEEHCKLNGLKMKSFKMYQNYPQYATTTNKRFTSGKPTPTKRRKK